MYMIVIAITPAITTRPTGWPVSEPTPFVPKGCTSPEPRSRCPEANRAEPRNGDREESAVAEDSIPFATSANK
jgi:hypothetical protein